MRVSFPASAHFLRMPQVFFDALSLLRVAAILPAPCVFCGLLYSSPVHCIRLYLNLPADFFVRLDCPFPAGRGSTCELYVSCRLFPFDFPVAASWAVALSPVGIFVTISTCLGLFFRTAGFHVPKRSFFPAEFRFMRFRKPPLAVLYLLF